MGEDIRKLPLEMTSLINLPQAPCMWYKQDVVHNLFIIGNAGALIILPAQESWISCLHGNTGYLACTALHVVMGSV